MEIFKISGMAFKSLFMVVLIASLIFYAGCNDDDEGGDEPEPEPTETLWQIVQNTDGADLEDAGLGLDSLEKYVSVYPELLALLNSSGSLTLFAPTNAGFKALLDTEGFPDDITLIDPDLILGVLFYHVVITQALTSEDLTPGSTVNTALNDPAVGGQQSIVVNENGTLLTGSTDDEIQILEADIKATNGVLHVTNKVLIPPYVGELLTPLLGTVAGSVMLAASFTDLRDCIVKADAAITDDSPPLVSILANPDGQVTLFAPPNLVFELGGVSPDDFDGSTWRAILTYHIIPGVYTQSNLTDREYTTLFGEKIYTSNASYINGQPIVPNNQIDANNGVVHVFGGLLLPGALLGGAFGGDVVGVAKNNGFDSLVVALELTGLTATLQGDGPFTVFAPPNQAFEALLNNLGLTALSQVPTATLTGLLTHHVVPALAFSSDLSDDQSLSTVVGVDITVNVSSEGVTITDGKGLDTPVVKANIKATNGVIHVIGGILQPL